MELESEEASLRQILSGWHVKDLEPSPRGEQRCVHVLRMLVNWRIVLSEGECDSAGSSLTYGYCYNGTGLGTMIVAIGEASVWDGDPANPPKGWVKEVHTGRYFPEGYGREREP